MDFEVIKRVAFDVMGEPVPQGSTKSFYIKKLNRVVTTHSNKNTETWRQRIATEAQKAQNEITFYNSDKGTAYAVEMEFVMTRPKSMPKKIKHNVKRPDLDKLIRATLDGITNVLIPDDSQVISIRSEKRYCLDNEPPHLRIVVNQVD